MAGYSGTPLPRKLGGQRRRLAEQVALTQRRARGARGRELLVGVDPLGQHRRHPLLGLGADGGHDPGDVLRLALALMPVLYPDVIKLDLRLLRDREPEDVARIVTAVGAEAEKRLATVLAEGIDSEEQLATARAAGATLGQGYMLGEPAPLPDDLPNPGRGLRLTSSGGVPENVVPYQRVTNWRRPAHGPPELAERAAALLCAQAAKLGSTGLLLAATPDDQPLPPDQLERYEHMAGEIGFVGVLGGAAAHRAPGLRGGPLPEDDPLRGTWTEVALGPGYGACFVARRDENGGWRFATSYDHETVVECAVVLMARMPSLDGAG